MSTHLDDPAGYWGEEGWEQQVQDSQEKIGTEDKKNKNGCECIGKKKYTGWGHEWQHTLTMRPPFLVGDLSNCVVYPCGGGVVGGTGGGGG